MDEVSVDNVQNMKKWSVGNSNENRISDADESSSAINLSNAERENISTWPNSITKITGRSMNLNSQEKLENMDFKASAPSDCESRRPISKKPSKIKLFTIGSIRFFETIDASKAIMSRLGRVIEAAAAIIGLNSWNNSPKLKLYWFQSKIK